MKVIFIKNVPKVGKIGEIKEMPDGYVRNFLLPQKYAVIATKEAVLKLENSRNEIRVEKQVQKELFRKNMDAINDANITISAVANEKGHLFKAVHGKDIASALKKQCRIIISEEFIKLDEPLKQLGTFLVTIEALGMSENIKVNIIKG